MDYKERSGTPGPVLGVISACLGALVLAAVPDAVAGEMDTPLRQHNVVLITADDLGPHLGCYSDRQARTPNLDRLAAEGFLFERAYVTQSSCSPSRSTIFTGLYPHQNGHVGTNRGKSKAFRLHDGVRTLPQMLKEAGYVTGVIGKIHVEPDSVLPFDFVELARDADASAWIAGESATDRRPRDVAWFAKLARDFVRSSDGTPFFLMLNYPDPHRPFQDQVAGIPERTLCEADVEPFGFLGVDSPVVRGEVAGYYNSVARLDHGVGLLLEVLAEEGQVEDTVVLFTGDQGPAFTRAKTTCYEAAVRVPLILRWPGHAPAGETSDALVSAIDIVPTVLAAAGEEPSPDLPGASLAGLFHGRRDSWRTHLFTEFAFHGRLLCVPRRAVRGPRYKLIANLNPGTLNPAKGIDGCVAWQEAQDPRYDGTAVRAVYDTYDTPPEEELYDLLADPHELVNLAGQPGRESVLAELRAVLQAWRVASDDPLLDAEDPCVR